MTFAASIVVEKAQKMDELSLHSLGRGDPCSYYEVHVDESSNSKLHCCSVNEISESEMVSWLNQQHPL